MPAPRFTSVLFLCVANSARSQIAEALARARWGERVRVMSAGSRPTRVHPCAIEVMRERGLDLAAHASKSAQSLDLSAFDLVITLCADEVCPIAPGATRRLHWPLPDPAGDDPGLTDDDRLARFRRVADAIAARLDELEE